MRAKRESSDKDNIISSLSNEIEALKTEVNNQLSTIDDLNMQLQSYMTNQS